MRCPAQSATGGWVIPGLLSKWFPLCEFSLLVALTVKHLPTMRETQVQSLGWEDLLEKEMATHSTTLALKIPWTEEPGRLQSTGLQRLGHKRNSGEGSGVYLDHVSVQTWSRERDSLLSISKKIRQRGN